MFSGLFFLLHKRENSTFNCYNMILYLAVPTNDGPLNRVALTFQATQLFSIGKTNGVCEAGL